MIIGSVASRLLNNFCEDHFILNLWKAILLHFLWILLRTCFVDVIGEELLDCETIFVKFTILEFKGNLGYRSMRCLISVSWTYNFKYFCPVISDSLKSDRLRYLAWKSFYKIFRTFRAKGEAQIEYFAKRDFLSNQKCKYLSNSTVHWGKTFLHQQQFTSFSSLS